MITYGSVVGLWISLVLLGMCVEAGRMTAAVFAYVSAIVWTTFIVLERMGEIGNGEVTEANELYEKANQLLERAEIRLEQAKLIEKERQIQ